MACVLQWRLYYGSGMMKPTDQETIAIEKSLLLSSQEEGARQTIVREAPGSVRRQKERREKPGRELGIESSVNFREALGCRAGYYSLGPALW